MKNKSWKTTLFGIAAAVGTAMQGLTDPNYKAVGAIIAAIGLGGLGVYAKDRNVSGK